MGAATSSIVVNLPSSSPSSSEPVHDASSPSLSSSSEPAINNASSSSPSSSSSPDPVDGILKNFICIHGGCKGKYGEVVRVCNLALDDDDDAAAAMDVEACAKAVAALRKCVEAKTTVYEGYVRGRDTQQEEDPTDQPKIEA
jgi:cellulase/cellobiase CelA1